MKLMVAMGVLFAAFTLALLIDTYLFGEQGHASAIVVAFLIGLGSLLAVFAPKMLRVLRLEKRLASSNPSSFD